MRMLQGKSSFRQKQNGHLALLSESMNLSDMEISSPYEQEARDPTKKSQELVAYTKTLPSGQVDPYILEIRRRLQEDIHARREREKRRRKVLVDQLRALEAIEVMLVCLLRKSLVKFDFVGFETRRIACQSFTSSIAIRTTSCR